MAPVTEYASTSPAATYAAPVAVIKYVAPVTEYASFSPASAYAAPVPVTGPVAPVIVNVSRAAAHAEPAPITDSVAPVTESMSPAAADAAPDPVMEYVTSALAEPFPVDEHMSEKQLTTAAAALRQREEILQCLLEAEASLLGDLLAQQEEKEEAQRAPKETKRKRGPFRTISYDGDVEYQVTSVGKHSGWGSCRIQIGSFLQVGCFYRVGLAKEAP